MFEIFEKKLTGKKVAIVATDGFEHDELFKPKKILESVGAEIKIISIKKDDIKSWSKGNWAETLKVDQLVTDANSEDFDALVIPGGVMNPDKLRTNEDIVQFAKEFILIGKPVAAICHGPWVLIETGLLDDCTVTSWPSLKTDLLNAGATWVDQEVVVDQGIITSRKPDDIPAFCRKIIEEILDYEYIPSFKAVDKETGETYHARI